MKILFTGSTAKQVCDDAHKRARVKRIDDCSIICNSLRKQGFDIDRKRVEWGEDLSEYGLAYCWTWTVWISEYIKANF